MICYTNETQYTEHYRLYNNTIVFVTFVVNVMFQQTMFREQFGQNRPHYIVINTMTP